jgi:hypothetical protein
MIETFLLKIINRFKNRILIEIRENDWENPSLILQAKTLMAADWWRSVPDFKNPKWIQQKEFRAYSQFGDDGIIQFLVYFLKLKESGSFIEFGVGDFFESNTHFLLVNNGWSGYVMDGGNANISKLKKSSVYWRYDINAKQAFIDKENINSLLNESGFEKIDLLHIDLDGNDYWILHKIDLEIFNPEILILEYNATFGCEKAITIPYNPKFYRMDAHFSSKFFGASLPALADLAGEKGYYFIGCNSAGNNAYFLANRLKSKIPPVDVKDGFQEARFRESRSQNGELLHLNSQDEINLLKGMKVYNVKSKNEEKF